MGNPTTFLCKRLWFTEKSTIGELWVGNQNLCYILEDPVREGQKISGETAIPYGKYELVLRYSDHFNMLLPLFLNVPNFTWIEFHPGNNPSDTRGCPVPGMEKGQDYVSMSRKAFAVVFSHMEQAIRNGKIYWEIVDGRKQEV